MPDSPDLPALSRTAGQTLLSALAGKGAAAGPTPDIVLLGFADLQARCSVLNTRPQDDGVGAAIGVEITGPHLAHPIRDVTGARGATLDEALFNAMQVWLNGLYLPLREALGDEYVPYPIGIAATDTTTGDVQEWCVYQSPLHIGGEQDTHEKLYEQLKDPPLFNRLVEAGLPSLGGDELHWMKLDIVGEDAKTLRVDAVFDSQRWAGLDGIFKDLAWPGRGIQMVRQYWVLIAN